MRIEDLSPRPLKGPSVGRSSDALSTDHKTTRSDTPASDQVSLSGLARLVSGPPAPRVEQLRNEVAAGSYQVPPEQISRGIVEFYLEN
jgi:anti-sigma28 factor (negative regulator of flagellin synthesis)